jgi:predicted DNA-binding transcriptional regulator AlpA
MLNELLNQRQAAARLGLGSPRTLESWRLRGFGPAFVRLSSRLVRYRVSDLDEWIAARVIGAGVSHKLKDDGRSDSPEQRAR